MGHVWKRLHSEERSMSVKGQGLLKLWKVNFAPVDLVILLSCQVISEWNFVIILTCINCYFEIYRECGVELFIMWLIITSGYLDILTPGTNRVNIVHCVRKETKAGWKLSLQSVHDALAVIVLDKRFINRIPYYLNSGILLLRFKMQDLSRNFQDDFMW